MRTAIISDIHGNRAAFEAVLADLPTNLRRRGRFPYGCLSYDGDTRADYLIVEDGVVDTPRGRRGTGD